MNLPTWFPLWAFIICMVLAGLLLLWLIILLNSFIFKTVFKRNLKNESNTINMLLYQRYEMVKDIIGIAEKNNVNIPAEEKKMIFFLERIPDFQLLSKSERDSRVLSFIHGSYNIISICDRSSLKHNEEYIDKLVEFNDVESNYRQVSALYNSNINGYNYWISVLTVKWVYRLFKVTPKDTIV